MTTTDYVIGVDLGTGGCKATVLESTGRRAADASVSYASHYEHPLWVEQDPDDWVAAARDAVSTALAGFSPAQRSRVRALGFSGPHHVAVLLDAKLQVLRRSIMWNDQRSGAEAQQLASLHGDAIFAQTGNVPAPTWTLPQLAWLRTHEPDVYGRLRHIVFMKDYVRYRFCGELATDRIEAAGTLLFDIHRREWSAEMLSLVSLEPSAMPQVKSPSEQAGVLRDDVASSIGLKPGITVITGTADTAAEVYGAGGIAEGQRVVKLATAGNSTRISTTLPPKDAKVIAYDHVIDGLYYLNSATNFAAASYRWFREAFYPEFAAGRNPGEVYREIDEQISGVPAGADGLLFHPYLNGERAPYWDPNLRASFLGIKARHGRAHFARAVMEGVMFSIRDAGSGGADAGTDAGGSAIQLIGGGSNSAQWRQIAADILGARVEVPAASEASFGVCLIAATAAGWYASLHEAVEQTRRTVAAADPEPSNIPFYSELFDIYRQAQVANRDVNHRLSRLAGERDH